MKSIDLVASGYCSLDHIIKIKSKAKVGQTSIVTNKDNRKIYYGGCNVNVAYALAKLNKNAMPIIRVGDDYKSTEFKAYLEASGINLDGIGYVEDAHTSGAYLIEDDTSNHITLFYPGAMSETYVHEYKDTWFKNTKMALMTVASKKDNEVFFNQCIKYDVPLYFGVKMDKDAFPKSFLKTIIKGITGIFMNENEAECLVDLFDIDYIINLFDIAPKLDLIVITKGKQGSLAYHKQSEGIESIASGIVKTDNFVDAVGSGDAYIAGFMYGLLNKSSIKTCMHYGATLSSFAIEGMGATSNLPTKKEFLDKYNLLEMGDL